MDYFTTFKSHLNYLLPMYHMLTLSTAAQAIYYLSSPALLCLPVSLYLSMHFETMTERGNNRGKKQPI